MSRHKAYALNPRDCLKTTLFQKWQKMVAPPGKYLSEILCSVKFVFFFIFIINFYTTEYITGKKYLKLVFETSDRTRFGLYRFFYTNLAFELKRFFS